MKKIILSLCLLAAYQFTAMAQPFPVKPLVINGSDTNRINLVMMSDGYQAAQLGRFDTAAMDIVNYIFTSTPFKEYRNFFNSYAIEVPSVDSGVVHAGGLSDCPSPAVFPSQTANTFFQSSFDNWGIHRSVYAHNTMGINSVLAVNFPMYDVPFVLVNTPQYGGTGGPYITSTINVQANETAVHEMGHTFGKLADEYFGNANEAYNMTATSDTTLVKWRNWLKFGGIGVYPYGTTGAEANWFRPHQNCKMRLLGSPLCAVCNEGIINEIYKKMKPIDWFTPSNTSETYSFPGTQLNFLVKPVWPEPSTLTFEWELNGTIINNTDTAVTIDDSQLKSGNNRLLLYITDTTALSRTSWPDKGYVFPIEWAIRKGWRTSVNNVQADNKFSYSIYPSPAHNTFNISFDNNTRSAELQFSLVSTTGAVVKQGKFPLTEGQQEFLVDVSALAPGVYTCVLLGDGIRAHKQLVIK